MHSGKRPLSPESMAGKREEKEELGSCSTLSESDVSAFVSELTDQPTPPSVNQSSSLTPQGNYNYNYYTYSFSYNSNYYAYRLCFLFFH